MDPRKQLTIPADTAFLANVGQFIQENCQQQENVILVDLAVTELLNNAIKHGAASSCTVIINGQPPELWIQIVDDGKAFNPLEAQPRPMGELRVGGYGIGIVREVADLAYRYEDSKNVMTLTFRTA